ncbi:tape measure protein [Arthrobacter phage Shrooms]|nr:tape measure protein [Arthrobacter phage Shrooms]
MSSVVEVMAKLSGNASGMVGAFREAAKAAQEYKEKVQKSTEDAVDKTKAAAKAASAGKDTGTGFASGFKGAIAGLGAVAATVGLAGFIKEAAAASDATDKFKATMQFAGLKTDAIDNAQKAAKRFADQTVYDLPTIQNTVAQLASNGIKDYTGLTQAAGNLNAVAGGNAETFKSVAMMMTQTAGAGKLTTENWNQLSDAIPGAAGPLMRALEEAGAYTGNFREAMEKGQITSDEFNAALMKLGTDPVAVEAAKSTKTFEGAIGSLQATINSGLMGALNAMKPAITGVINGMATGLGASFDWIGKAVTGLRDLFVKGDFTGALREAFHVEEDSPVVGALFRVRDAASGVFGFLKNTAMTVNDGLGVMWGGIVTGAQSAEGGFFGAMAKIGNSINGVFTAIGPAMGQIGQAFMGVLPSIMTLVQSFSPLGIALTALTPVLPLLASTAGQLAATLGGALASVLQVIAPIIAGIVTGVSQAVTWFMSLNGSAEALAGGITALVAGFALYNGAMAAVRIATAAWAAIQGVLNAVMAINPVTLIIIGIAALVAAIIFLVANWDNVVKFMTDVWQGFVGWFQGVMAGFVGFLGDVWNNIINGIVSFASGVFAPIAAGFNAVLTFITDVFTNVGIFISEAFANIAGWVGGAVSMIVTPIVDGFNSMVAMVTGIFTAIGDFITGVWTWIFNLLTAIGQAFWAEHGAQLTAAWEFIVSIFTAIVNFYVSVWTTIIDTVVAAVTWVVNAVVTGFTAVYNGIALALTTAWNFIVSIWTQVTGFLTAVMTTIGSAIAAAWNWIVGIISGALSSAWSVIVSIFTAVWSFIVSIFTQVSGFVSGVWNTIFGVISGVVNSIRNAVSAGFNAVWSVVSSVFNNVSSFVGSVWNNIVSGVTNAVGQVGNVIGSIYGKITGALAGAGGWLLDTGRNIVQGLINGVQSLAGSIGSAFLSMVPGWIVGPFKAALGIASPSKLFKKFGGWIMEGLGIGVNDGKSDAVQAMGRAADAVTAAGSGITLDVPKFKLPEVPNIADNLALPALTQEIRLNFTGTNPVDAIRAFQSQLETGAVTSAGRTYNAAALAGTVTSEAAVAPVINLTAVIESPFGDGYMEARITNIATDAADKQTGATVRVAKASRGVPNGV